MTSTPGAAAPQAAPPPARPHHVAYERSTHSATLAEMFLTATAKHRGAALRFRVDSGWADVDYAELGAIVREIARGLIALGIERGHRVAILSNTRPEWTYADAGALCAGAVIAPVYQSNSPEECRYVLEHSGASAVFCEDQGQLEKVRAVRDDLPHLEHVIAFAGGIEGSLSLDDLREAGARVSDAELEERAAAVREDDVATLVYTSGTTGPPKGCMLTHRNFAMAMQMYEEQLDLPADTRTFMFLPLAHVMARIIQMLTLDVGGTLLYWTRDSERILDDIQATHPTHFPSVPRLFEKIHTRAMAGLEGASPVRRAVFAWALRVGRRARAIERRSERGGRPFEVQHDVADRLVFRKVRALFGGRLQLAVSAAAPIPREILEFFDACGITIREAWGMSETTAAGTLNTLRDFRFGTVGRPLPGIELRIEEDGEVMLRGANVMEGYWRDRGATREALRDGWLATGDVGSVQDGYLSITGRKREIIITSSGKNITSVNMENELRTVRWVEEAVVFGDNRPYLVAMVTLDQDELPALAEELGLGERDPRALASGEAVREAIRAEVDRINERFARIEQVKRFAILDHPLTQAAGELTPTLKVKRSVVYERYADLFAGLYEAR